MAESEPADHKPKLVVDRIDSLTVDQQNAAAIEETQKQDRER